MRVIKNSLIACALLWSALANANSNQLDNITIQQSMRELMQAQNIPGAAVLLYEHGKMHAYYFGEANPQKHIPVSANTIFEIGSVTKTFTALLLAENIIAGKMQLNDSAADYLHMPASTSFKAISLLQLATHTSSLPFNLPNLPYNATSSKQDKIQLQQFIQTWIAPFSPGTQGIYSNLAFGVLGEILSKNADMPLQELLHRNILLPLGMTTSGINIKPADKKQLAQGFDKQVTKASPAGLLPAAWAMKVSVKDMQAYLKAALQLPGTPQQISQAMQLAQTAYYNLPGQHTAVGLAWTISSLDNAENIQQLTNQPAHYNPAPFAIEKIANPIFNSNALIGKTGATDGFRAYIAVIPKTQTGIVMLINRYIDSSGALQNLANKILLQVSDITLQ